MAEFTFLKFQFDDASFAANAPFTSSGEAEVEVESEDDEDSRGVLPLLLGLLFLIVVAVAVKKFLGGGDDLDLPAE